MSFKNVFCDLKSIYAIQASGELLWYRDLRRDGTNGAHAEEGWDIRCGSTIGSGGWDQFRHVFSGGDGIIYAIKGTGELLWYKDDNKDGTIGWHAGSGNQIGVGWDQFTHVFSGGDGIIYAVRPTGELLWYRDLKRDGTNGAHAQTGWDPKSGSQIGLGWDQFEHIFSGGNGIIYAIRPTGELLWYQDLKRDGTNGAHADSGWHANSGNQIGIGWRFPLVFSGGDGVIYAIRTSGELLWYRDVKRDGTNGAHAESGWDQKSANQVGIGWTLTFDLEGYCFPLSAAPGETIQFFVSSLEPEYAVTYLRLKLQADGSLGIPMAEPFTQAGSEQPYPVSAPWEGCEWDASFSLTIPDNWSSDLYAAYCADQVGNEFYIVFVVKPDPASKRPLAILANTNTWTAYNAWGGKSHYSPKYSPPSFLSLLRPNPSTTLVSDGQGNHLTLAELWVLSWLEDAGYAMDVYCDHDFHLGIEDLSEYRALILNTHPEYWTLEMRDQIEQYLAGGGRLLYLGGNGLFEKCVFDDEADGLFFYNGATVDGVDAEQQRVPSFFRNLNPPCPERPILGVAYEPSGSWTSTRAPYKVEPDNQHRFFSGVHPVNGEIGQTGLNGAASGWEMDTKFDFGFGSGSAPGNCQLLARGTNNEYGSCMTYYDHPGGGFVFSAGSLCFGGSLVQDANLQIIAQNALNECLGQ